MDVDHRNFGEDMGLDQRPICNNDSDIDRVRMMFDKETLDICTTGIPCFCASSFTGLPVRSDPLPRRLSGRVTTSATSNRFSIRDASTPAAISGVPRKAILRTGDVGNGATSNSDDTTTTPLAPSDENWICSRNHSASRRIAEPSDTPCSLILAYSAIARTRCCGCIRSNIRTPLR